jgi:hypothetical protein
MDAVFIGRVSLSGRVPCRRCGEGRDQSWRRTVSLTLSLPGKAGQSSFPARLAACSLVGQLFPFSVIGVTFMLVPRALSH